MKKITVSRPMLAVALTTFLPVMPALAQSIPPAAANPTTADTNPTNDQILSGLGDIVVTAQRKSENLQRVPVSIAAIAPEKLANLNLQDLKDIQFAVPSMTFAKGINYSMVNVRGVGSYQTNPGLEPAVATYIDGAYLERGFGSVYDIVDPASVQILRGPQGTLWGRNATGGVVLITTADPEKEVSARITGELGSLGHRKAEGVLNVPLGDAFAARVAVRFRNEGGYIDDLNTTKRLGWSRQATARVKLAYKPGGSFDAVLEYQYDHGTVSLDQNANVLPAAFCALCSTSAYTFPLSSPYQTVINNVNGGVGARDTSNFGNLRMNLNAGDVTVTSITAYRKTDNFAAGDFDLTDAKALNLYQPSGSRTFTQTLQAISNFPGSVNFSVGVDYLHDKSPYALYLTNGDDNYSPTSSPQLFKNETKTDSISAFAEFRLKLAPNVTLTGGGRYTHDKRELQGNEISFNSFTPRAVLAYDAGQLNLYASYNRGFKAGGFNSASNPIGVFKGEKIDSYEVGAKFFSRDRTLRLNLGTFLYKYRDIQVIGVDQSNLSNISVANNAGSATGKGFELEGEFQPAPWAFFFGGLSYLDANYDKFVGATLQLPVYNAQGAPTGFQTGNGDLSGYRLPRAPRWTGNFGATLRSPIASGWSGELTASARYSSSYDFSPGSGGPLRAETQRAFTVVQLTARLYPDSKKYEVGFFVDNLTDTVYDDFRFSNAPFGSYRVVARPRTYGVSVTARY